MEFGTRSKGLKEQRSAEEPDFKSLQTENQVDKSIQQKNKDLVLKAFDTLFNKRDYATAETFWSPKYVQHSAHIEPGREGLFNLVKSIPATLKYEPGLIVADDVFVIVHGRFSGMGLPVNWIAADILRVENGILVEHWDVIQDEASEDQSKSKAPMFGSSFPVYGRRKGMDRNYDQIQQRNPTRSTQELIYRS